MGLKLRLGVATDYSFLVGDVVGPASYSTGGFAIGTPATGTPILVLAQSVGGYNFSFDYVNKLLLAYRTGAAVATPEAETAAATNLSALTIPWLGVWLP